MANTKTQTTAQTDTEAATAYRIEVHHLETCNCNHGCGCQFGGYPDHGGCETILGYEVIEGNYGDVDLSGLRIVEAGAWPGAIHEGGGHVVMFVDENATDEQVEAVTKIFTGDAGGMPWEALGATIERFDGPIRAPIEMHVDGRSSSFRVPGAVDVRMTPLQNPVSGEDQDVHITYPQGGLMWNDGAVGTTEMMRLEQGDLRLDHPGQFAAYATPTWSNQI